MVQEPLGGGVGQRYSVAPTTSDGVAAMSPRSMADLLRGLDPVTTLEAASTVLADIENNRYDAVLHRLLPREQRSVEQWRVQMKNEGTPVAPTPVVPLAVLAATTLALGQAAPEARTDSIREQIANRLVRAALRFNDAILGTSLRMNDDEVLAFMCRSALWRDVENEDWMIWSGELVTELSKDVRCASVLASFRSSAGITVEEWWYRGFGEGATRAVHGARSWGPTTGVSRRIEAGWTDLATTPLAEAVSAAAASLVRRGSTSPPLVGNPFDLTWLTTRPVVATPDGRRFQLWLGANNRSLLPAGLAQVIADTSAVRYDTVAAFIGGAAERRLTAAVTVVPGTDLRIPEKMMPSSGPRCDYLIETDTTLVGIEFTIITPTRNLTAGNHQAIADLVKRLAKKVTQIYRTFQRHDAAHAKRWLPLAVLASPSIVDPLLNERVHRVLVESNVIGGSTPSELMTCHTPEFLDLLQYVTDTESTIVQAITAWRDSTLRGTALDWWLSDRGALRCSGRARIGTIANRARVVLACA